MYAASPEAAERKRNAELTGALHRVCGLLGLEADIEKLGEWCSKKEKELRDERESG
jgi:hypothetical protein